MNKRRSKHSRAGARTTWLILAIVVIFLGGIFLSGGGLDFVRSLYGPVAVIVVILLIVEYVVLKGRDRSRFYRIEIEQMREKRRSDAELLRHLGTRMRDICQRVDALDLGDEKRAPEIEELRRLCRQLEDLRQSIARLL